MFEKKKKHAFLGVKSSTHISSYTNRCLMQHSMENNAGID